MEFASALVVVCIAVLQYASAQSQTEDYDPSGRQSLLRPKRSLVYPPSSTLLLIFGLGTPLQLERESVIVGAFAKMIYVLPSNSTDFTQPGTQYARSRWSLYRNLARLAELYGFGHGRSCLLRSICEAAAAPFDSRLGLLHQLLHTLLTPSSTKDQYEEYQDREYHAAERLGGSERQQGCHALYPECRASLLNVFSSSRQQH